MDAADYQQEQEKCRKKLAADMGREDVPDEVWGHVEKLGLVYDAITSGKGLSRQELLEEARARLRESLQAAGRALPPGRGSGVGVRAAPHEVTSELSDVTRRRAEAFAEVAANMAHDHPGVREFRRQHLRDGLLSEDEARTFLDRHGGPLTYAEAPPHNPLYNRIGHIRRELLALAVRLGETYRWREGDAQWFVLTGHAPPVRPVVTSTYINNTPKHRRDYHPSTATITVSADAWVEAGEVERAFRNAQRQILGGDARSSRDHSILEAVKFVARRMREHPGEPWKERLRVWNETHPESQKQDFRALRQAFERFAYREHHLPNWQRPEKTPYEDYMDEWLDAITSDH